MNALQLVGDRDEMIRLTARATQKLAFFYFPIYVFLIITSHTFIITLFTEKYEASAPIFVINLTMLPFSVLILDPVVRSFKELGRLFLLTRLLVLLSLVAVLYFGLDHFTLTGMITAAVGAIVAEKLIAEAMVISKLGLGLKHLRLLTATGKTAIISLFAGLVTYLVYTNVHQYLLNIGQRFAEQAFSTTKLSVVNFVGGSLVLLISAMVFVPIYLLAANFWGVIEDEEKQAVRNMFGRFFGKRGEGSLALRSGL
jgi:O-antigen/teichoic acid export membrane protein